MRELSLPVRQRKDAQFPSFTPFPTVSATGDRRSSGGLELEMVGILRSSILGTPLFYKGGCQEKRLLLRAGPGEIRLASSPTLHVFTKFVVGRVMFAFAGDWFPIPAFPHMRSVVQNGAEPSRARRWARRCEPWTAPRHSERIEQEGKQIVSCGSVFETRASETVALYVSTMILSETRGL